MKIVTAYIISSFLLLAGAFAQESSIPPARCNESVFKPCICASQAPKEIKFRPKVGACKGKAAAVLQGRFADSFSVVLRDRLNRDRFPVQGFNGCTPQEVEMGLAKCSAYKCQKVIRRPGKTTCCFGGSGTSSILRKASRLTIKLRDVPQDSSDPLLRVCLPLFSAKNKMN